MKHWGLGALVVLMGAVSACAGRSSLGDASDDGCTTDTQCKGDRICVAGVCIDPRSARAPSTQNPPSSSVPGGNMVPCGTRCASGNAGTEGSSNQPVGGGGTGNAGAGGSSNQPGFGGSAGAGGSSAGTGNVPDDPGYASFTSRLPGATAVIGDPSRDRWYAVVEASAPEYPNSLVTLDPLAGTVIHSVSIGSDPDTLAVSDDGSTLWVGLRGALAVRKVDLTGEAPVPGAQFTLPPGDYGDLSAAGPMVVLPGTSSTLVISLHRYDVSPSFAGLVVLDDGVPRAPATSGHTGASRLSRGPSGYVFGFNNLHTGFGLYSIAVTAGGLVQSEHDGLVAGFDTDIRYDAGFLFATSGEVVDVTTPSTPVRAGRFPSAGAVSPDVAAGKVWMVTGTSYYSYDQAETAALSELDLDTFTVASSRRLGTGFQSPRQLVRSQTGVFGFIADELSSGYATGETRLYLVRVE